MYLPEKQNAKSGQTGSYNIKLENSEGFDSLILGEFIETMTPIIVKPPLIHQVHQTNHELLIPNNYL